MTDAPLTREDVLGCYRYILGREPESEDVIARHLEKAATLGELRTEFIVSDEFRARHLKSPASPLPLAPPPNAVESDATPEQLAAMLERTGQYWSRIGEAAPHWSVLTQDRFRPDRIAESERTFYATGETDRALVTDALARHGLAPAALPLLVEFGCGVGRATVALARDFERVIACDISEAHLKLGRQAARRRGLTNIRFALSTMARLIPGRQWDLWYSRLVLQHNPPPVIAWLLRRALEGLAPGGVAIFQVPTYRKGYGFAISDYLGRVEAPDMEMHVLPQAGVFRVVAETGCSVLDVREDTHLVASKGDVWLSNLFVVRRLP